MKALLLLLYQGVVFLIHRNPPNIRSSACPLLRSLPPPSGPGSLNFLQPPNHKGKGKHKVHFVSNLPSLPLSKSEKEREKEQPLRRW
ncbi:hypothetical protein F5H01DRAFT_59664 [Linnemannia elongata]|nr:hypothetical protein F5H01DRAFT_59664 [Linnemannia elongata]